VSVDRVSLGELSIFRYLPGRTGKLDVTRVASTVNALSLPRLSVAGDGGEPFPLDLIAGGNGSHRLPFCCCAPR